MLEDLGSNLIEKFLFFIFRFTLFFDAQLIEDSLKS
jgi:hypothetical protein